MRRILQGGVARQGERWVRYMPELEMRRPAESSKMYRAVQDWKPSTRDVAHAAGKSEVESENVRLHMILVDKQGFRWPIRFNLQPGMTLWDVFHQTDAQWFGVLPNWLDNNRKSMNKTFHTGLFYEVEPSKCKMDNPHQHKCNNCMVLVPYEYLDAMSPPSLWETEYLKLMVKRGMTQGSANMRVACQVYVEEWMDGLTLVLPQEESVAFQMYYQQGVDKESVHNMSGMGHSRTEYMSDGYSSPKKESDPLTWKESLSNRDLVLEKGSNQPGLGGWSYNDNISLKDIFWTDNVDDVIRAKHPTWKGHYEFLNK